MLDPERQRQKALEKVLFEAAWQNERVANKFRGGIWLAVGIAMFLVNPSATPVIHFTWGVLIFVLNQTWMKRRFERWMPWVLTTVDVFVLVIGMHAGYAKALEVGPLFGEHHLSGAVIGLMLVLGVNMMRFDVRLTVWTGIASAIGFTTLRLFHARFDLLTMVDWVLVGSLSAMLIYTARRFRGILERVMIDLRALQEARVASLSNLVAGVAHEMNTPLGALSSNRQLSTRAVEILRERIPEPEKKLDRALTSLERSQTSTEAALERLDTIVTALRSFARLDEADVQMVDLRECLDACLELLPSEARGRIEIETAYDDVPKIPGRPSQLNQVFMALLENAVQAIDGAGRITVRLRADDGAVVEIEDTGRGIEKERLATIFDPAFTRAGPRAKMSFGLTSSQTIVNDHGGELRIESEVGVGTTVSVRLPASD